MNENDADDIRARLRVQMEIAEVKAKRLETLIRRLFTEAYDCCKVLYGLDFRVVPWSAKRTIDLKQVEEVDQIGIHSLIRIGLTESKQAAVIGFVFASRPPSFLIHWLWAIPHDRGISLKYGDLGAYDFPLNAFDTDGTLYKSKTMVQSVVLAMLNQHINYIGSLENSVSIAFAFWERLSERR